MSETMLTLDDFSPHVGTGFTFEAGNGSLDLVLADAHGLPDSGREGGAFRLEFEGPLEPMLGQGIYKVRRDDRVDDIFIVPVARTATAMLYEAVYF